MRNYKYVFFIFIYFVTNSCISFHTDAKYNTISSPGKYISINNPKINFGLLSYGDFIYASDRKKFKKIYNNFGQLHPVPKKLILYAATKDPQYYYYVYSNSTQLMPKPAGNIKTINCDSIAVTMVVQESAPKPDLAFLLANFKCKE